MFVHERRALLPVAFYRIRSRVKIAQAVMLQVMGDSVSVVSEPCIHISINTYICQWYRVALCIHLVIYIDARGDKTAGGKLHIHVGKQKPPL